MRCFLLSLVLGLALVRSLSALEGELKSVTATVYSEIVSIENFAGGSVPGGTVVVFEPPKGKILCGVIYHVSITGDQSGQFTVPKREFGIDGALQIGEIDEYGELKIHKKQDWAEGLQIGYSNEFKTQTYYRQDLYLLEPGTKEVTFKFGAKSHQLKLDQPPVKFDPTPSWKVTVHGAERKKSVEMKVRSYPEDKFKLVSPLVNPGGDILEVKVTMQPTTMGYDAFVDNAHGYASSHFFLSFGKGGRAVCLGSLDNGEFQGALTPGFTAKNEPKQTTLYFAVPATVTAYELNYMGHAIGKCTAEVLP